MKRAFWYFLCFALMFCLIMVPFSLAEEKVPSGEYGKAYVKYGDIDANQAIDAKDALLVLRSAVGKIRFTTIQWNVANVNGDKTIDAKDALLILRYSVGKIKEFSVGTYYVDLVGEHSPGTPDGIPDKYQKKITFTVKNGSWENGSTADYVVYVTLTNNGVWDEQGTASLTVPTNMIPFEGYEKGGWLVSPPLVVSRTESQHFFYFFDAMESEPESSTPQSPVESEPESSTPQPPVESEPESSTPQPPVESEPESEGNTHASYTVEHYQADLMGEYPSQPTQIQQFTGKVGDTVVAQENIYEGYCFNAQVSVSCGVITADGDLVLRLYYDIDKVGGEEPSVSTENYITRYNKSNSVNGAYEKDTTADTSFVINSESLTPYAIYVMTRSVVADLDHARLVYSLQGLLNRDFGTDAQHSSLLYMNGGEIDAGWLNEIIAKGTIMQPPTETNGEDGLTQIAIADFNSFYDTFREVIASCGIILWDGNVPATANVAATICGLDGYLPVLANSPLHQMLVADGIEVKQSLVGLFVDGGKGKNIVGTSVQSTGSAKNDAYLWALEKYFSRCTTKYLAYVLDGACTIKGYDAYEDNPTALLNTASINCLANHDYLIARRCFFFDLAPYKGEAACDDPAQKNGLADAGSDNATMLQIYQARYNRANGEFGDLMGFPPWWLKYTAFREQGSQAETWVEWLFCEYITCYNLAKEADAQAPAAMSNGSVYYKYVPKQGAYTNNKTAQSLTFDKNTYYYTIYLGDYDSSAWLKEHMYTMWIKNGGDAKRGTLPLMWGINPNLSYRVPMIFDYLYENKSANDYFVGGDGGAGYVIPAALFHDKTLSYMGEKRPSENAAAGDLFAQYTKPFYERFDLDITGFLINGNNGTISQNIAACVNKYSPIGSFANASSMGIYKYNGTYYVNCYTGIASSGASSVMYDFAKGGMNSWFNKKNFGAYRTVCHTPTQIAGNVEEFAQYASGKGMTVQYCDPYTYFSLLQQSGQGNSIR